MYIKPLSVIIDSHSIIHLSFADDLQSQMSAHPDGISELLHSMIIIIIIMVISKCYFTREHIALSYKKWCEHRIRKNEQIESTAHDRKTCLK